MQNLPQPNSPVLSEPNGNVPIQSTKLLGLGRSFRELGWVGASQLVTAVGRFLTLTLVARALPPRLFGEFAFFVGLSLVVANLTDLGLGRTLVRFVGEARGNLDFASAQEYCGAIVKVKVLLSVVILFLGILIVCAAHNSSNFLLVNAALTVGSLISFGPLVASMFQVQGMFRQYFYVFLIDPIRLLAVLCLFLFKAIDVHRLLWVYALSPLILIVLAFNTGLRAKDLTSSIATFTYLRLWSFGRWLFLIALLEALWQRLDVLMLEALAGPQDVGIYSGAYMFMGVAALVATSVGTVIYPRMAEAHGRKDAGNLAKQYVASTNVLAYLGLPCVLGISSLAPQLVKTVLGSSYLAAADLFAWLTIYGIFLLLQMNVGALLFAIGKPQVGLYLLLFQVGSGTVGNLLFIPRWHAHGAAAVLAICTLCSALLSWSAVFFYIGVWPNFRKIGLLFLIAILMYMAVRFTPLPLTDVSELAARALIGIIVYLALVKIIWKNIVSPLGDFAITHS